VKSSRIFQIATVVLFSCATAACQTTTATSGSGYQMTRFANPAAARLASQDPQAGPAIAANNAQCRKDEACRK
jgi:hypothetical protein